MNIYDEAIEKVDWIFSNSKIPNYELSSICVALERAKKVEELLGLYQSAIDLMVCVPQNETYHYVVRYTDDVKFNSILNQINKKEEEMKK